MKMRLYGGIDKYNDKDRIIHGYGSVAIVDDDNQYISTKVLSEGMKSLFEDEGIYANLMLFHGNIKIGKILKSYKDLTTHVDEKGLHIVAKIRKGLKIADKIWNKILNNELTGLSIGAEMLLVHDICDDNNKCISIIDKLNIYEVSVCDNPTNTLSNFSIITKSKAKELGMNICKEINERSDNMEDKDESNDTEVVSDEHKLQNDIHLIIESYHEMKESLKDIQCKLKMMIEQNESPDEEPIEEPIEEPMDNSDDEILEEDDEDIKLILKSRDDVISKYESENKELREEITKKDEDIKGLQSSIKKLEEKEQEPITSIDNEESTVYHSNLVRDGKMIYKKM